jgi:tripartite-type tricarboxylate transporter receptor subunit TctC
MAEQGYRDIEAVTWVGMFAPAGTPREIIERLNAEINRIIRDPDIAAKLDAQGIAPAGGPPGALGALVTAEIKRWTAVARENKITMQQ